MPPAPRIPFGPCRVSHKQAPESYEGTDVSILWIILVVIVVLALLGYFGRGRRRAL
jgi:hypothetical protein